MVVAIVVLKDSPIKSIHDLKGKRIVTGDRGWGTTELAEALMAAAGMPPDKFKADGGTHQLHVHHRSLEGAAGQERGRDLHPGPGRTTPT